jgi:putative flippase GtrA
LNKGTTIDKVGADDEARAREAGLVGFTAIFGQPAALVSAIYTAPERCCRARPTGDMSCCANRKLTMIPAPLQNILDRLAGAWHERAIALKATSFALVGVVNTAVDFCVFWTTATYLHWPLVPANVLAWIIAVTFSYAMNSFITFGPESGRVLRWRDYASFAASGIAGMISSTATLFALSYFVPVLPAKLASILVSFAVNFSLSHFVVFRARRSRGDAG